MTADKPDPAERAFLEGVAAGKQARATIGCQTPFDAEQQRWLAGFLQGLLTPPSEPLVAAAVTSDGATRRSSQTPAATPAKPPPVDSPSPPTTVYHRDNPYAARLNAVVAIPGAPSGLRRVVVDIEGSRIQSSPGDWLGVFPQNDPDVVRSVLKLLGIRGQDEVQTKRGRGPVWRALLEELDLSRTSPALVELMAGVARDRNERRALSVLASSAFDLGTPLAALLRRFPSARPQAQGLVSCLQPLEPSLFPIASSIRLSPSAIEAFLLLNDSEASSSDRGIATPFVAERLRPGDWLPIYVEPGGMVLPDDDNSPVILIADGPGIGVFLAFLAERFERRARGRNWLWVEGEAFAAEVERWQTTATLTRVNRLELPAADYVREALRAQADTLWRWLIDRTPIYVCGSPALIDGVEAALCAIAISHADRYETTARRLVARMRDEKLLVTDVVPR